MSKEYSFPSELKLRLDWSEMDLYGHINNVAYAKYIQASRVNYWEIIGLHTAMQGGGGPVLAATDLVFKQPLHYPGNILVKSSVSFLKVSSFGLYHQILDENYELAAEAKDVIVLYDYHKNTKLALPEAIRQTIMELESKNF